MTIRLLCAYDKYPANAIITLDAATEAGLVLASMASPTLTGGTVYYAPVQAPLQPLPLFGGGRGSIKANEQTTLAVPEGQSVTVTGAAATVGSLQRYDATGAAVGAPIAVGAGTLAQLGPFSGAQRVVITCTAGSIDAVVGDAVLGATISSGSGVVRNTGERSVAIFGPSAALAQKGLADQTASVRAGIDTYNSTPRFVENWLDTTAWAKGAQPFTVSGGKMYAGATQGGGSNGNHSFASAVGEPLRWSVGFTLPAAVGVGSLIIGFDSNTPGTTPGNGASTVSYGVEFNLAQSTGVRKYVNGVVSGLFGGYPSPGNYTIHWIADANWLSFSIHDDDRKVEGYYGRVLRSSVTINNLFLFNGDTRQLTGASINPNGVRAAIQPALAGQAGGAGRFSQYTASDAAGTVNYRIWGPAGYDPRRAWPTVMLFHGDGSDENMFASGSLLAVKDALVAAGYLVMGVGISANKSTWGAQSSIDATVAALAYLRTNYSVGPIAFLAVSMGGIESLNCLASKKIGGVVAWVGISPTANLASAYARVEFTTKINTAYGITGSGQTTYALCADGYDPMMQTDPHAFQDLPMMFVAATDDTLVTRALNTDLLKVKIAATAAEIVDIPAITGGHSFDVTPYAGQIVAFFDRYAKA